MTLPGPFPGEGKGMDGDYTDWHRLFGLILTDFFSNSPFNVETEIDLSLKQQFLDVVIRRKEDGALPGRLPDGLENLAQHNLFAFRSHQEMLDDWTLKELTEQYVDYRKQAPPWRKEWLPEEEFQLYAVSARYPQALAGQTNWSPIQQGVCECRLGTDVIRVLVLQELPRAEHNALLHLFSGLADQVRYGMEHYRRRSYHSAALLRRLAEHYQRESVNIPYTPRDVCRDEMKEHLHLLTIREVLQGLVPEEWHKTRTVDEELHLLVRTLIGVGLSREEIINLLNRWANKPLPDVEPDVVTNG